MNKHIIFIGLTIIGIACYASYIKGYNNAENYYKSELNKAHIDNLKTIENILLDRDAREKSLVSQYLTEIELLKEEQTNEIESIKSAQLSNTTKCMPDSNTSSTRVSTKVKTRSNTICYAESELLRKVKESLVITAECDQLAIKYNTLLEVCNGR